jgi:DNA-binding Lrp family transcriptional regulator
MSIFTKERREELIRGMYKLRRKEPRIGITDIAKLLEISRNAASHHLNRALEEGILFNPQLKLLMTEDIKEYFYAISSDNAFRAFHQLQKDNRVLYEIFSSGYADLLLTTSEPLPWNELDELGRVMLWGTRSNYICPEIPATDYVTALSQMEDFSQR